MITISNMKTDLHDLSVTFQSFIQITDLISIWLFIAGHRCTWMSACRKCQTILQRRKQIAQRPSYIAGNIYYTSMQSCFISLTNVCIHSCFLEAHILNSLFKVHMKYLISITKHLKTCSFHFSPLPKTVMSLYFIQSVNVTN